MDNLLTLLIYLFSNYNISISELAERFGKSERTIERYIKQLRELDFDIRVQDNTVQFNSSTSKEQSLLKKLLGITAPEALVLNKALSSVETSNALKSSLQQKLGLFDTQELVETQVRAENSQITTAIHSAIKNKQQILFRNYSSGGSGGISDRLVEPFEFKNSLKYIMCYEHAIKANRLFKIDRIQECIETQIPWEHEEQHKSLPTDVFRICGELNKPVKIQLSSLAKNLLAEEYPLSESHISKTAEGTFIFETMLAGYQGVSRFCMGLPDNVEVLQSEELQAFIKNRQKTTPNLTADTI